jgi:hypothetical protein
MLILLKSSPNKYNFWAEERHFKKKILPIPDWTKPLRGSVA